MPTTDQTHQVVHPLHGAGLMQGNLLERHALELTCSVETSQIRMVTVHWCLTSGDHERHLRTAGGNHRTDLHRNMKTTAAKQGRQKETHR